MPATLCDALLSAADRRLYCPLWTETILDEMERNAARLLEKYGLSAADAARAARYRRTPMTASYPEAAIGTSLLRRFVPELK